MANEEITSIQPPCVPDYGTRVVILHVGQYGYDKQEFLIHEKLLCAFSRLIDRTLNSGGLEAGSLQYSLPDENPVFFHLVQHWLYSGRVPKDLTRYIAESAICDAEDMWYTILCMGQRLEMDRLQLLALEKLEGLFSPDCGYTPSTAFVDSLFEDAQYPRLEQLIVGHVAYWCQRSCGHTAWMDLVDSANERFCSHLAYAMVVNNFKESTRHPLDRESDCFMSPSETMAQAFGIPPDRFTLLRTSVPWCEKDKPVEYNTCISDGRQGWSWPEPATTKVLKKDEIRATKGPVYGVRCPPPSPWFGAAHDPWEGRCIRQEAGISQPDVACHSPLPEPADEQYSEPVQSAETVKEEVPLESSGQVVAEFNSVMSTLKSVHTMLDDLKISMAKLGEKGRKDVQDGGAKTGDDAGNGTIGNGSYSALSGKDAWGYSDDEKDDDWSGQMTPSEDANADSMGWDQSLYH